MTDQQETTESAPAQERQETDAQVRGFVKIDAASYTRMVRELTEAKHNCIALEAIAEAAVKMANEATKRGDKARGESSRAFRELRGLRMWLAQESDYVKGQWASYKKRLDEAEAEASKESEVQ